MTVLLVYAHPEPRSFTGTLRDCAIQTLQEMGHEVLVSDLYAMGFNPVPGWHDFVDHDRQEFFGYEMEQKRAAEAGSFAPDLQAEMEKLVACDLLILNFPLWWFGLPAILKGWVDRVFAAGFAYGNGRWFDRGVFCGKRAMLALTTGGPETAYTESGLQGDIEDILRPIHHGILHYTGFDVLPPFVAFGATYKGEDGKAKVLASFERHLRSLSELPAISPEKLGDYDEKFLRQEP